MFISDITDTITEAQKNMLLAKINITIVKNSKTKIWEPVDILKGFVILFPSNNRQFVCTILSLNKTRTIQYLKENSATTAERDKLHSMFRTWI